MSGRARRRALQPPTRLPDLGAHGVLSQRLGAAGEQEARGEAKAGGEAGGAPAPGSAETDPLLDLISSREAPAAWGEPDAGAEDAARTAWYLAQRPPHWG